MSHNIYYVKSDTREPRRASLFIMFAMCGIQLRDNAIVNNFSTDLSIKKESRAQPPKYILACPPSTALIVAVGETLLKTRVELYPKNDGSFGRDASGVATLLGELVCTSSTEYGPRDAKGRMRVC